MESLNKVPSKGRFGDATNQIDTNFGLLVTKITELENTSKEREKACGYFADESALTAAVPTPEVGMVAYVGTAGVYYLYRCTVDGQWQKTEEKIEVNTSVDLSDYALSAVVEKIKTALEAYQASGALFLGMATVETDPGTPTDKVFYLPFSNGDYAHFGNLSVNNELCLFYWDGAEWSKLSPDVNTYIQQIKTVSDNAKSTADEAKQTADETKTEMGTVSKSVTAIFDRVQAIEDKGTYKHVFLTEEEYDKLEVKEADTIYMLYEE